MMVDLENQIVYLIKDLGFPIAMCIYFMTINNKTIKKNTDALIGLKEAIILGKGKV